MIETPYIALPSNAGPVYKPLIRVRLNYPKTHKMTLPVTALIDSGADVCFCSDFIGAWLGIDFKKIKEEEQFTAANGGTFQTKSVNLKLIVGDIGYNCKFYFTDVLPRHTPIILGQIGFFDRFKITFDAKREIIRVE